MVTLAGGSAIAERHSAILALGMTGVRKELTRDRLAQPDFRFLILAKFLFADVHVSLLSRENRILLTRASEERAKH